MFAAARRLLLCTRRSRARRAALAACLGLAATAAPLWAEITAAHYGEETTRYAHGVLGDAIEYGRLEMTLADGTRLAITLPQDRVFEDLAPRLVDMDGNGSREVITVESSQTGGARLAIYDEKGLHSATPHIGQRNRWLAPIGAADLDGDGHVEVAYIDRPHLAKTLRVWRFEKGKLTEVASKTGLTNHRIGEDFISGGLRDCGEGPEMITVDAQWHTVIATRLKANALHATKLAPFTGQSSLKAALNCTLP